MLRATLRGHAICSQFPGSLSLFSPGNLTILSKNLNALLAKVVEMLNVADLTVSQATVDACNAAGKEK